MSMNIPEMPAAVENDSFIPTLDRQGAIWLYVDAVTQEYLEYARQTEGTMLEVAAGYGHVVIKALEAGAGCLYANEIDAGQLAIIKSRVPAAYSNKLVCCLGRFPEQLEFADESFDGIYNARLFHFFDGERIRAALEKFHRWLKPGGEVFLVNDSVYRTIFGPLIPIYEDRVKASVEWPGFFEDIGSCLPAYLHPERFPKTMNFMDPAVLSRELGRAGFEVMTAKFCPYTGNFSPGRLDGRELAVAVARKEARPLQGNA
jgi:ubiquinone/menaquinone biosynthesis C-methylase UbiE